MDYVVASKLGWLFDGYEAYAVFLTVGFALRQLPDQAQFAQIPVYAGIVIALTLLGWGIGGMRQAELMRLWTGLISPT
jgi:hypothetical protein